jgi:hypothetical protein
VRPAPRLEAITPDMLERITPAMARDELSVWVESWLPQRRLNPGLVQRGSPNSQPAELGERCGQGRDRTADLAVFSRVRPIQIRPGSSVCAGSALLSRVKAHLVVRADPGPYGLVRTVLAERWQNHPARVGGLTAPVELPHCHGVSVARRVQG